MLKGTIFKICFAILIITFCSCLSISVIAQDRKEDESCNIDIIGITTVPGNFIIPDQWICEWYPSNPLEFDDASTPNTIPEGGTINVYVIGGYSPFIWSDPGLGFTWLDGDETIDRQNRLHCATGTCGIHYAPFLQFAITDQCGSVTETVTIRVAGAEMGWLQRYIGHSSGSACYPSCWNCTEEPGHPNACHTLPMFYNIYSGQYREQYSQPRCTSDKFDECPQGPVSLYWAKNSDPFCTSLNPGSYPSPSLKPAGIPVDGHYCIPIGWENCPDPKGCHWSYVTFYEWGCKP